MHIQLAAKEQQLLKFYDSYIFNPFDYSLLQSDRLDPIGFVKSTTATRAGATPNQHLTRKGQPRLSLYSFKIDLLELRGV